jgi:pimeloyl-ACP methyl ester carboxylesterase
MTCFLLESNRNNELATDVSPHTGETVTYGYLASSAAGELVAIVRGTQTMLEWLHDFSFLFVPNPIHAGGGLTEDGFTAIYRSLRAGADPNSPSAISAIANRVSAGGISNITVAGHSLGAALATLLALDVGLNSGVGSKGTTAYTFASPRVGELFFQHTYDSVVPDTYRICNRPDVVPPVVVRAAQVIAALGADQLAVVAGEPVRAVGADLAVVLDRAAGLGGRTRCEKSVRKIGIEGRGRCGNMPDRLAWKWAGAGNIPAGA